MGKTLTTATKKETGGNKLRDKKKENGSNTIDLTPKPAKK